MIGGYFRVPFSLNNKENEKFLWDASEHLLKGFL